jgi:signal transduction histidine kinase
MAQIEYNGGIVIRSTGAPKHVVAKRSLEEVLLVLENIQESFTGFNPHNENDRKKLIKLIKKGGDIKHRYVEILDLCSGAVKQLSKEGEFSRAYTPLLSFLERTSDAHNILPFLDYISVLEYDPIQFRDDEFFSKSSHPKYVDFVSLRIEEAVHLCRSYISLLSGTMDLQKRPVNLMGLAASALFLAQQRTKFKVELEDLKEIEMGTAEGKARFMRALQKPKDIDSYKNNLEEALNTATERLYSSTQTTIYSYEPLIFFYLTNVLGNHFKASYEHEMLRSIKIRDVLPNVSLKIEPWNDNENEKENILLNEDDDEAMNAGNLDNYNRYRDSMYEKVCITTRDNGLGIPEETLATLFEPDRAVDERYRSGNGKTLQVFPLVCDLLGADLYIDSHLGKYTEFKLVLPRRLVPEGMIEID